MPLVPQGGLGQARAAQKPIGWPAVVSLGSSCWPMSPAPNLDRCAAPVPALTPGWPTPGMGVCWLPAVHVTGWLRLLLVL